MLPDKVAKSETKDKNAPKLYKMSENIYLGLTPGGVKKEIGNSSSENQLYNTYLSGVLGDGTTPIRHVLLYNEFISYQDFDDKHTNRFSSYVSTVPSIYSKNWFSIENETDGKVKFIIICKAGGKGIPPLC